MDAQKLNTWVQVVTSLAIVIGLALVILELQQSREIARAQISSDSFALGAVHNTAMFGEQAAAVKAKA